MAYGCSSRPAGARDRQPAVETLETISYRWRLCRVSTSTRLSASAVDTRDCLPVLEIIETQALLHTLPLLNTLPVLDTLLVLDFVLDCLTALETDESAYARN